MGKYAFSLGPLLWQLFNLAVLLAVFVFLGWRVVRMIRGRKPTAAAAAPKARPLCKVLREHRVNCKMTQELVAEKLGVSRQAVSKWESGAAVPSTANLIALAKLFGIPVQELLQGGKEQVR